jgi:EmrB/QacA subfamily drug resistance transporter
MSRPAAVSIPRDRRLALALLCAATLMTIVDETVVSVALPTIQGDLGFATSELSWVVNAYLIAFGGLLLLAGRIGDLVGRRRVLLAGLSLFVAASVLCGVAPSAPWLVAARFAQGAGGALAAAVALGMVVALFDDPRQRARAIGVYSFVGASGASIGLFLGGLITDAAGWRWVFFINVPFGIATVLAGRRVLARDTGPGLREGADVAGSALLVSGLMLAIVTIVDGAARGLAVPAALLLAAFAVRQATAARPLIALEVLRSRLVVGANAAHTLLVGAMFGFQFLVTLYFQRVLGYSPAQAGLGVLPVALGIGGMSLLVFPRIDARFGARAALLPGLLAIAAGLALLSRVPVDGHYLTDVAPSIALFALGGGLTLPAIMTIAMSGATPDTAGLASGLINTSQQVGGALGLAILAALAAGRAGDLAGSGAAPAAALVGGFQLAWSVAAGFVLAALALAALVLRAPRPAVSAGPSPTADASAGAAGRPAGGRRPSACSAR